MYSRPPVERGNSREISAAQPKYKPLQQRSSSIFAQDIDADDLVLFEKFRIEEQSDDEEKATLALSSLKDAFRHDEWAISNNIIDFSVYDTDRSGTIDFREFQNIIAEIRWSQAEKWEEKTQELLLQFERTVSTAEYGKESDQKKVDEAFQRLRKQWDSTSVDTLHNNLKAIRSFGCSGSELKKYLSCLVAKVPFRNARKELVRRDLWLRRRMSSSHGLHLLESPNGVREVQDLSNPDIFTRIEAFFPYQENRDFHFAVTSIDLPRLHHSQLASFVIAISEAGVESGAYSTLFVSACLSHAWRSVQMDFWVVLFFRVWFLILLMFLAGDARNKLKPAGVTLFLLFVFAVWEAGTHMLEAVSFLRLRPPPPESGRWRMLAAIGFYISQSSWTFHEFAMSFYTLSLIIIGLLYHFRRLMDGALLSATPDTWLYLHPMWTAILIGFKANQLVIQLLAVRSFGQYVVPAYRSIFDRSSLMFMAFVGLNYISSVLAYYAIPVQQFRGHDPDLKGQVYIENIFMTFARMFQLDFGGEADLEQLEGDRKRVVLDSEMASERHASVGAVSLGEQPPWHYGVYTMYAVWSIWITLILLNVFIGLLGTLYSEKNLKRRELFEDFRAVYTFKLLLRRHALEVLGWKVPGVHVEVAPAEECERPESRATWIAYDPRIFEEEEHDDSELGKLRREILGLRNKVDTLARHLTSKDTSFGGQFQRDVSMP